MEKKRKIDINADLGIVQYPCENFKHATNNNSGFLIGSEGYWHNGIHLHTKGAIKSICDGEIVALRLNESYLIEDTRYDNVNIPRSYFVLNNLDYEGNRIDEYFDYTENGLLKLKDELTEKNCKSEEAQKKRTEAYKILDKVYSNCFILLKHKLETTSDEPNPIVFYSLYNHLKPLSFLTPRQKSALFCYTSRLNIKKFENYGYVEAYKYDNSEDRITLVQKKENIKIPSETRLYEGSLYRVRWTLNGQSRISYIKKEYVRSYNEYNKQTKKTNLVYETKRASKNSQSSCYLSEEQKKKIGTSDFIPVYNSNDYDTRNVIATVSKKEKIILGNENISFRTFFNESYSENTKDKDKNSYGIMVNSKSLQIIPREKYILFSLDTIKVIKEMFHEYISKNGYNYFAVLIRKKEEWSLIPDQGLFVNDEPVISINLFEHLKTYAIPTYSIKLQSEFGSIINNVSDFYRLPSEIRLEIIPENLFKSVSWTINGKTEEALLDTNKILFYSNGKDCETKRPKRFFDAEDPRRYLSTEELKRSTDKKIIIYNNPERGKRNVKYVVSNDTNFIVDNFSDLENLFKKQAKDICEYGIHVYFDDKECGYGDGYLYFDMQILEKNNDYKELLKKIQNISDNFINWLNSKEEDNTETFGGIFEYNYEMKSSYIPSPESVGGNEVLLPDNDNEKNKEIAEKRVFEKIKRGTILGFAGYTLLDYSNDKKDNEESIKNEQNNEDATSVHFEIFTPNIKFTNFSETTRKKYTADIVIKRECLGHSDKKTTITKTKYLNLDVRDIQEKLQNPDSLITSVGNLISNLIFQKQQQLTEDLTLCYFKKTGKTVSLVDSEKFIELEFKGKLLEFNEKEFITRSDFDNYITSKDYYTVNEYKKVDSYIVDYTTVKTNVYNFISAQLNPNLQIPLYPDMKYPGGKCVNESPTDLTKRYRQTEFVYLPGITQNFFVPEKAMENFTEFEDLLLLINGKVLKKEDVLEEPTDVKWSEEEIIIPEGSYTDILKTFTENKKIQWHAIKKDNTIYWIKETDISSEIDCSKPAEKIIYDDWNKFFTNISSDKKNWGAVKCAEKDKLLESLNIEKGSVDANDDMQFITLLNSNRSNFTNIFYKSQTEWNTEYANKIVDTLKKHEKDVKKKMLEQLCFWDELDDEPGKNKENYYFNPIAFLHHLDKVATPQEFNPYEGATVAYYASPSDRKNKKLSYYIVKHNPGFAPLYNDDESYEYEGMGRFGRVTGSFNEDYQYLDSYKNRFSEFYHEGLDLRGKTGTPVKALILCKVIAYGWYSTYGQVVFLSKKNDVGIYMIAHLSEYDSDIYVGKEYLPGETVGYVGTSGKKKDGKYDLNAWENPHLHITYYDSQYTDKISIEINNTSEIVFPKNSYTTLVSKRKNPFIHDSEDRKPKKDLKGNIVQ